MVDPKLIAGWIEKADEDLKFASASLTEDLEFYSQICFLLHQAVEKYLKDKAIKLQEISACIDSCEQMDDNDEKKACLVECQNKRDQYKSQYGK